jgi:hypothetical protein
VIEVVPGYEFSQYETLRTIELYHGSKFKTGSKDSLKREKPFYNICKFRVNVAVRAIDLDTKDVLIEADDMGAYGLSFKTFFQTADSSIVAQNVLTDLETS